MSWLLLHHGALASLRTDSGRVPADAVAPLADALAVLARAETLAAGVARQTEVARAAGYDHGFLEGLAAGRAQADAELAATRAGHAAAATDAVATVRAEATALALAVVAHIAGALAPEAVLAGLAATALDRLAPGPVTVRVAPASVPALTQQLAPRPGVRVLGDPTLGRLDLVLETGAGRVLAGLPTQLAQIAQSWDVADAA